MIGDSNNALTKMISKVGLIDVHSHKHGLDTDILTYKRGPRRLDYMFVSRRLIDHIKRCGYEKFDTRMVSDHRGYFADFSIKGIFDRRLPKLLSNIMRGIKGNNPVNITKYIISLFNYIEDNKLLKKA